MDVYNLQTMQREESVSSPLSVALGNFDGVHIGHAELIRRTVEHASANGHASAVWTFSDGAGTLPNKPGTPAITTTEEKLALIASMGVDYAILESFSDVRGLSPEQFVKELLVKKYSAVCTVCGYNFRFGAGGTGDSDDLRSLMAPHDCIVVPPVYKGTTPVSSSAVRALLKKGDMEGARGLLGRPFYINLPVIKGKQLGRTIGIPTINQSFPEGHIVPMGGIYICTVSTDSEEYMGVANVGTRPTVDNDDHVLNCETHIIDCNKDLYGKNVKVAFHHRLRDELRFDSIDGLRHQIQCDIEKTKHYFKGNFKSPK